MKLDGFELKVHSIVGLVILLVVFWAAYRIGNQNMLGGVPFFGGGQSQ